MEENNDQTTIEDKTPDPKPDPQADATEALQKQLAQQAGELERFRRESAESKADEARKASEAQAQLEGTLQAEKKYKQLAEIREKEIKELRVKDSQRSQAVAATFKSSEKQRLAIEAGIRPEALGDIDYFPDDELELRRTEGGKLDVSGGEQWIKNLKESKSYLFKSSTAPNVPGGRPSAMTTGTEKINWSELEKKDPDEYKRRASEAVKSGKTIRIN